jgi:hypothetical protein
MGHYYDMIFRDDKLKKSRHGERSAAIHLGGER